MPNKKAGVVLTLFLVIVLTMATLAESLDFSEITTMTISKGKAILTNVTRDAKIFSVAKEDIVTDEKIISVAKESDIAKDANLAKEAMRSKTLEVVGDNQVRYLGQSSGSVCFNPTTKVFTVGDGSDSGSRLEYRHGYAKCNGNTREVEYESEGIKVKKCDDDYMEVACTNGFIFNYGGNCGGVSKMEGISPKPHTTAQSLPANYEEDWHEFPSRFNTVNLVCSQTASWMQVHLTCVRERN